MRRSSLLVAAAALTTVGLVLGLSSGSGAQTVDGLDLTKVRARAQASPEDAEAFASVVARRGDALRAEAAKSAAAARANARGLADRTSTGGGSGTFDFDAMVKAAGREAAESDDTPRFIAFASLSMPEASLRRMIEDVGQAGGAVVFRGFPGNSARRFTAALARAVPSGGSNAVGIDPRLFRAFRVEAVPTYVVVSTDFALCDGFDCTTHLPPHDRMSGNVTALHALSTFADGQGSASGIAKLYRDRLAGGAR